MSHETPPKSDALNTESTIDGHIELARRIGRKHLLAGAAWCLGGAAVTWATMANAKSGGTYVVAWGAIIAGGIELIYGLRLVLATKDMTPIRVTLH